MSHVKVSTETGQHKIRCAELARLARWVNPVMETERERIGGRAPARHPTRFATCLNCIDGRVQLPVIQWVVKGYPVEYVDLITEPGIDGIMAGHVAEVRQRILRKLDVSVRAHGSKHIFVVGHHDCAANLVSDEEHLRDINTAAGYISENLPHLNVVGLWVSSGLQVMRVVELGSAEG